MKNKLSKNMASLILLLLAALLLNACGSRAKAPATATPFSVEAVYTMAAQTLSVQLTGMAQAQPSATPTLTASPSNTAVPTATFQAAPVNTTAFIIVNTLPALATFTPGPSPTASVSPTARTLGCNDATFISHITYPDNSVVEPGQEFTKIWEIKNSGSGDCAWTNSYRLIFVGGNILGSDSTRIGQKVGVGANVRVRLEMTAPNAPGTYTSQWRMATADWQSFGDLLTVIIKVPGPTHTPTSLVTNTSEPTVNTPAPTVNTPEPTVNTPEPTVNMPEP